MEGTVGRTWSGWRKEHKTSVRGVDLRVETWKSRMRSVLTTTENRYLFPWETPLLNLRDHFQEVA